MSNFEVEKLPFKMDSSNLYFNFKFFFTVKAKKYSMGRDVIAN